jgi:hypothetical protein
MVTLERTWREFMPPASMSRQHSRTSSNRGPSVRVEFPEIRMGASVEMDRGSLRPLAWATSTRRVLCGRPGRRGWCRSAATRDKRRADAGPVRSAL